MLEYVGDELRLQRRAKTGRDHLTLLRMGARLHLQIGRAAKITGWLPLGPVREVQLRLTPGGHIRDELSMMLRTNDVAVIEIFGVGAYDIDFSPLGRVETVLDIGANVGTASIYLASRFPGARLFCVEASAPSFALLAENLRRNVPTAASVNAALVAQPGHYRVEEALYSGETRVVRDDAPSDTGVTALTMLDTLATAGFTHVDLLKLDIEGSELGVFERAADWAQRVGAILAEVHPPLTVAQAQRQLAPHGYRPLPLPAHPKFNNILFVGRADLDHQHGEAGIADSSRGA